jgi:hypothetical protein
MAKRKNAISGQFTVRLVEMLESPAFRVLSLSALRALSRIEIEFAHHSGCDNGKLRVTFNDFERYGIRRHSIGPALDELETLGFATITQHGKKAIRAEYRRPTLFLLTTRPELEGVGPERCRWRRFKTCEEAVAAREASRQRREKAKASPSKNWKTAGAETALLTGPKRHRKRETASANGPTTTGRNGTTIYISGRDPPSRRRREDGRGPPRRARRGDGPLSATLPTLHLAREADRRPLRAADGVCGDVVLSSTRTTTENASDVQEIEQALRAESERLFHEAGALKAELRRRQERRAAANDNAEGPRHE